MHTQLNVNFSDDFKIYIGIAGAINRAWTVNTKHATCTVIKPYTPIKPLYTEHRTSNKEMCSMCNGGDVSRHINTHTGGEEWRPPSIFEQFSDLIRRCCMNGSRIFAQMLLENHRLSFWCCYRLLMHSAHLTQSRMWVCFRFHFGPGVCLIWSPRINAYQVALAV